MKKTLVFVGIIVCITAARVAVAQLMEGAITYEIKINTHRTLPPERQEMKDMIPEFRTFTHQLLFNSTESLYKPLEEEEDDFDGGDHRMQMKFKTPKNEVYVNHTSSKRILLQEFMGKDFLIEDSLRITPWKFGSELREVSGYPCRMARYYNEDRKQNITAWYTDKLRPFLGPEIFNTLPGAVLLVDINNAERVITAVKIESRPLRKNELRVPERGTKVTEKEFKKFVEEQTERMRANGANVIIRN